MTLARKSLRALAYASSVIRLSRVMRGISGVPLRLRDIGSGHIDAVRDPQQRQRMRLERVRCRTALRGALLDTLKDRASGDGTVGADVIRLVLSHQTEDRLADLHRRCVVLGLHAPRAVMSCAPLDSRDR